MYVKIRQQAFSLLEMAIVLGILSGLLGSMITPLSAKRQLDNLHRVRLQLSNIEDALYGYAITHGALPCPTLPGMGGLALDGVVGNCEQNGVETYHGFIPHQSLGIRGKKDCNGLLLDPWGQPYRYSVSPGDQSANGLADFVRPGEIRREALLAGLGSVRGRLRICGDISTSCDQHTAAKSLVADKVVAIVFSLGSHNLNPSKIEKENAGETTAVSTSCMTAHYGLSDDDFFYQPPVSESPGKEFDDEFIWISSNVLYAKMLAAGQLP